MANSDRFSPVSDDDRRSASLGSSSNIPRPAKQKGIAPPPAGSTGASPAIQAYAAVFKAVQSGIALHHAKMDGSVTPEQHEEHTSNMGLVGGFSGSLLNQCHVMIRSGIERDEAKKRRDFDAASLHDAMFKEAHSSVREALFGEKPKKYIITGIDGTPKVIPPRPPAPRSGPVTITQGKPKKKPAATKAKKKPTVPAPAVPIETAATSPKNVKKKAPK